MNACMIDAIEEYRVSLGHYDGGGGDPLVVFHASPSGTVQSPWQPHDQSTSSMISFCAATNVSSGHIPSGCWGQPLMLVSGVTPSLMMIRICSPGVDEHWRTVQIAMLGIEGVWGREDVRWNWMLVENGASWEALKDCLAGIWSHGSGPDAARLVRFRVVMTTF